MLRHLLQRLAVPYFVIAVALILLISLRLRPMAYITGITRLAMPQVLGEGVSEALDPRGRGR